LNESLKTLRGLPGLSLLLIGSGLYWLLSSQLISSFTVLAPGLFQSMTSGTTVITVLGIVSVTAGLWIVDFDFSEVKRLASANDGWVFVVPVAFAALDIYSTLINLSTNQRTVELNPFVAAAVQYGPIAVFPFVISYFALSQGLALFMLRIGRWLFTESGKASLLPFSIVCGVSAFGPSSNLIGMGVGYDSGIVFFLATVASAGLCTMVFLVAKSTTVLRTTVLERH
jgi:hypothetical protein